MGVFDWLFGTKQTKESNKETMASARYRDTYRGERGSDGMSVKDVGPHSRNCECNICLYGHDPGKGSSCQCRSCEGYRSGKPLH